MQSLEILTSIALGIGLAAAVGLRVFLPLLVLSIAGYAGVVPLSDSFQWLATLPAVAMLGGAAGLTQGVTALVRAKSTATTGGLGNPFVATGELGGATVLSLLAIFAPIVALVLVVLAVWVAVKLLRRLFARRAPAATAAAPASSDT